MPRRKIPPDAFDFYFALGPARSYQAVADEYGVTKRAVTKIATKEHWQDQIAALERKARENSDERKVDALQVAHEQRLKALRMVLGKGLEGLRQMTIDSPADAVRAIGLAVREIRVELGEPSDRTAVTIEDTIKREYERWMSVEAEEPGPEDDNPSEVPSKDSC